jgi:hypothetical protein
LTFGSGAKDTRGAFGSGGVLGPLPKKMSRSDEGEGGRRIPDVENFRVSAGLDRFGESLDADRLKSLLIGNKRKD